MYSDSVVLKAISVCNLLHKVSGHPSYMITKPVRDKTHYGFVYSPEDHPPAISDANRSEERRWVVRSSLQTKDLLINILELR